MPDQNRQWFTFVAAKADGAKPKTATLQVYDVIGADPFFGGVDVNEAVTMIDGLDDDVSLEVRINSPGGAAWDGITLANAIMRHPGPTTTYVDGLAASAASLVAMAGDDVVMSKYAQMMLHNARLSVFQASIEDLNAAADVIKSLNVSMSEFYADRAGGEPAAWAKVMKAETWYTADEAKEAGIVTAVDESGKREDVEAKASALISKAAAMFKYPGRQAAPPPSAQVGQDGPSGPDVNEEPAVATSKAVLDALGLPEDATDEQVLAKIAESTKPADEPEDKPDDLDKVDEGKVRELVESAKALGLVVSDPGTWASLQANSELGAKAHAKLETQRITASVDAAISLGKIPPSRRDHFVSLMRADEVGTVELLAGIPKETAVPMAAMGHSFGPDPQADTADDGNLEDPRFTGWKF